MNRPPKTPIFVDSFSTAEAAFPKASVIYLTLHDSTAKPGEPAHKDAPFAFRLSPARARALARMLTETADAIEGTSEPRQ